MTDRYDNLVRLNLSLDLTRGRPSEEFLDTAKGLEAPPPLNIDGVDLRNYIGTSGLWGAREMGGQLLGAPGSSVICGSNSSMSLLHEVVTAAYFHGWHKKKAWREYTKPKVLFPVPGYDRHAGLFETFGLTLVTVPFTGDGMADEGFELLETDPDIVAMVCVPRHSNPSGDVWSDEKLSKCFEIAEKRNDVVVICDNAYAIHDARDGIPEQTSPYVLAEAAGALPSLVLLGSTSKIGFAGSGLSFLASDPAWMEQLSRIRGGLTLGSDPLNQGRHLAYFKDGQGLKGHFKENIAPLLATRFDIVEAGLAKCKAGNKFSYSRPLGGYFYSLHFPSGIASDIVDLAAAAGMQLTPAGSGFPQRHDSENAYLRLAPTSTTMDELPVAIDLLSACIEKATANT